MIEIAKMKKTFTNAKRWLLESILAICLALGFVFILNVTFVEANQVLSISMTPTLKEGDFIIVNKIKYGLHIPFVDRMLVVWSNPERGDVVTFLPPANKPFADGKVYIKRIVAVPGDIVEIRASELYINGLPLLTHRLGASNIFKEYIGEKGYEVLKINEKYSFGPFRVPGGYVFAVGDNRDSSYDSRSWGPVPIENITGKAEMIYFTKTISDGLANIKRIGNRL